MVKRNKRLKKGIESLKKEIEEHFEKLKKDIIENNKERAEYHYKEIDKSLIDALENKINLLDASIDNLELLKKYKNKLKNLKTKMEIK